MLEHSYKLSPTTDYPFYVVAKRYWIPTFDANTHNPTAKTLIVLHSTSYHKETWEPTLERLFKLVSHSNILIRDAWAIDCPNHGESAVLNNRVLKDPRFANFSCEKYASAVHRFLSSGPDGAHIDFRRRDLVGLGHSLGANAMLMLQHLEPLIKFSKLIIVEPMVSSEGTHHLEELRERLVSSSSHRQRIWTSREAAFKSFATRRAKSWDPRVLRAYVDHAIHWDSQLKAFTLSCSPEQETTMYLDTKGSTEPIEHLNKICHQVPTHLILGQIADFIPVHVHKALVDPKSGRQYASVASIPGIGHLVPQEAPDTLASVIYDALASKAVPVPIRFKL